MRTGLFLGAAALAGGAYLLGDYVGRGKRAVTTGQTWGVPLGYGQQGAKGVGVSVDLNEPERSNVNAALQNLSGASTQVMRSTAKVEPALVQASQRVGWGAIMLGAAALGAVVLYARR